MRELRTVQEQYNRRLPVGAMLFCCLLVCARSYGQASASPPAIGLSATDVFAAFHLPPLRDTQDQPFMKSLGGIGLLKRARTLGVTFSDTTSAWKRAGAQLQELEKADDSVAARE